MTRRTPIYCLLISLIIGSCSTSQKNSDDKLKKENNLKTTDNMDYKEKLGATKKYYPFDNWRESGRDGMEQYSPENCDKAQQVFDKLIDELIALGDNAKEERKIDLIKTSILSLNKLNSEIDGLIETGEREDLCELLDQITIASGLNPKDYADGEGIADLWRDW